ncbi:MAG: hydrophobic/amphiphilic exporter (mainly bacteria), family [Bacillota bacterium]|nr:hydrophobic/amphiphilic exporter (mainly bacteria), family [Bacillota bacterium]MDK2855435.1 hydrophobic/amphiphilic exporter (mainly bacteria), family [Bacillota bacterium]MDK2925336.1 hydrophobic/amphiphilic exporter (mainly bacteria), family [Bacillota bacterium]
MNLAQFSTRRPVAVTMVILVLIVLGTVSLTRISIDLLPKMTLPIAAVMATYPGAGPEEVEELVAKPLESVLATVSNVDSIQSISSADSATIIVQFNWGTDMDFATLDMREKIDLVMPRLPDGVDRPRVVKFDPSMMPIMILSVSSEGRDLASLKTLLEDKVAPRLERIEGVAYATVIGGPKEEVRVLVDSRRLAGYGFTLAQLVQALKAENLNMPGGTIEQGTREFILRTTGEFKSLDELRNLVLTSPQGVSVRLGDLADIEEVEDQEEYTLLNGRPSIGIMIQKEAGANTVKVANQVHREMEKLSQELRGLKYTYVFDQAKFIQRSIGRLTSNAISGAVLAIVILYLFLRNVRSTLVIALSIPISIIATFTLVYFNGLTINLMSLGGLALGVGMLVDNSIVVLENIYRHREEGESRLLAAQNGAGEVAMAITASTLTTIAVFLPIVFIQGLTAQIFRELALTVTFSLLASLLVALTVVPMLASKILVIGENDGGRTSARPGIFYRASEWMVRQLAAVSGRYRALLAWALDHRRVVLAGAAAAFILSLLAVPLVGTEFFPSTDAGRLSISIELPSGATLEETDKVAERVGKIVSSYPEVETVFVSAGRSMQGMSISGTDSNTASLNIELVPKEERRRSDREIADAIRRQVEKIPGAEIRVTTQDVMTMGGGGIAQPISLSIRGDDLDVLRDLADKAKALVAKVPGTREIRTSFSEGRPEVQVRLNRAKAASLGLSAAQVAQAVSTAVQGEVATEYRVGGKEKDIRVRLVEESANSLSDLKSLLISTPTGLTVPLADVADIVIARGPVTINREDQARVVTVSSDVFGRPLGAVSRDIERQLAGLKLPPGYTITFGGQNKEMSEAFSGLSLALGLAVILVYMVMAAQFESLLHPFTIMFSMPLALVGVVLALLITRRPISVPAFIGIIVLAGIVVNNAIVLVDYINTLRARGLGMREAILTAGPIRLRPILMTTLTTVLGLIPLALGLGEGGEMQAPLAITVIGGLSMSTLLTLVVVPLVYTLFEDIGSGLKRRLRQLVLGRAETKGAEMDA